MGIEVAPTLQHWNYFLALEDDVIRMSRFLEPTTANFESYSLELARILFAAASEVDVVSKILCKKLNSKSKADRINKYKDEIVKAYPQLPLAVVQIPRFGLTLTPWEQWTDNSSPLWWKAYNDVKHHRHTHFNQASLKHTLNAVAGLFVMLLFYYREQAEIGELNPDPVIFKAGTPFKLDSLFFETSGTTYSL